MYKGTKKILALASAAVLAVGALSVAACGETFKTPSGIPEGDVSYNGGFVVEKGDTVYFINGVESYTSDNTYGTPVRGSLMRIKRADVEAKHNAAETVIPSLMVAGDTDAGIFIYGDRIYYATPNNVRDTSGALQTGYLDFKSAKLDGTDIVDLFRLPDNSTKYRFVQVGETVYVVYSASSALYSYNTSTKELVTLAKDMGTVFFNSDDKTDPTVYYTMEVKADLDKEDSYSLQYSQIYRVRADAKVAPYTYTFDEEYVKNELDGELPYVNLGELVLDGWGSLIPQQQYNHPAENEKPESNPFGYTYTLQKYTKDGIYFTRTTLTQDGSTSGGSDLYYLSSDLGENWSSIQGNQKLDVVAEASSTSKTTSALFYLDKENDHHYIYVGSNNVMYRVDVDEAGKAIVEQPIAYDVSGATLISLDTTTDATYSYVYFTRTNGEGRSVERAVFNGEPEVYQNIVPDGVDPDPYKAVKVLDIKHANSWYNYELHGTTLYYADADNTVNSTSYNYVNAVSLKNSEGKLMNNEEIEALNDKYDAIMDADSKVGLIAKLNADNAKLSTLIKYYFYTGSTAAFDENLKEAKDAGKSDTYLYTQKEKDAFLAYTQGKGYTDKDSKTELFAEGQYKEGESSYRTLSYFVTLIGKMDEAHVEEREEAWRGQLQRYYEPETEEETGLPAWAWALIGVGIGIVVIGGGVLAFVLIRKSKKEDGEPKEEKMHVDTTDDRSVDVYADDAPVTPTEELTEAPAEETVETPVEPAEETAETPAEAPAEPVETEAPAEAPAPEAPAPEAPAAPAETPAAPETSAEAPAPEAPTEVPAEVPAEEPTETKAPEEPAPASDDKPNE